MLNLIKNRQAKTPPTREQTTTNMLKGMGVENPQPRNMNRNVMLSQIEQFDRSKLKPVVDQQRFMVSPHNDVRNFMANSKGMGYQALRDSHPMVRPVFKDTQQREDFHNLAVSKLGGMGNFNTLNPRNKQNFKAYEQLRDWSHKDHAMMGFDKVDTKRSHPIVFVQGHGSAGDKSIYSDSHEEQSSKSVARMLDNMKLPKVSQVRANSCFSGTQTDLSHMPNVGKNFREQTIENSAGKWSETFGGSLEKDLNQSSYKERYEANREKVDSIMKRPLGKWGRVKAFFGSNNFTQARKDAIDSVSARHNRVVGYMGPTSQESLSVKTRSPLGKISDSQHTGVAFGPRNNMKFYKHADVSRKGPSVRGK